MDRINNRIDSIWIESCSRNMSAELVSHASVRSSTTASKQFALAFFTDVINKHVQHVDDSNAL